MDKYKVYTWSGSGYMLNEYIVESDSEDEAFWLGVDLAIKDKGIYFIDLDTAQKDFDELDEDEKEGFEDYFDYYVNHMSYFSTSGYIDDFESDFDGFVLLENARVEKVEDDDIEK